LDALEATIATAKTAGTRIRFIVWDSMDFSIWEGFDWHFSVAIIPAKVQGNREGFEQTGNWRIEIGNRIERADSCADALK